MYGFHHAQIIGLIKLSFSMAILIYCVKIINHYFTMTLGFDAELVAGLMLRPSVRALKTSALSRLGRLLGQMQGLRVNQGTLCWRWRLVLS